MITLISFKNLSEKTQRENFVLTDCPMGQYKCPEGKCIMKEWLCDSYVDCQGGADEANCGKLMN